MCLEPLCLFTSLFGICLSLYWIISSNEQICHFFCSLPKSPLPFKPLFLLKLPPRLCFYLQQNSMKVLLTFISSFSLPIVLFFWIHSRQGFAPITLLSPVTSMLLDAMTFSVLILLEPSVSDLHLRILSSLGLQDSPVLSLLGWVFLFSPHC